MNFVNFIYHMIQFSFIHNGEKIEGNKTKLNPNNFTMLDGMISSK